jgi:D-beta-D-heptose 7-phosphate kinase/D-beta-D-heptose 1-phosphate adenosyltransferase
MKKVWINGCFDILHYGHFKLIEYAKTFGDILVIGIDSDNRVKQLKGNDRPFHSQYQREFNLMQINGVTNVVIFDTDTELRNHLKEFNPDIFVIGDEYMYKPIIGGEYAKEMKFFGKINGFSTTKLLDNE